MSRPTVGIDAMGVHVPSTFVEAGELALVRGVPVDKLRVGLGLERFAVPLPSEDAVVMAAEAAATLFERGGVARERVKLLLVGTESGVDGAKPVASFVHGLLGLPDDALVADVQHACFGATAALEHAALWAAHAAGEGAVALVIATDVARYPLGSAAEPTQGAGAVAMAVTRDPRLVQLFPGEASFASGDRQDFWRPLASPDARVDGAASVQGYLAALDASATRYLGTRPPRAWHAHLFHAPFPRLAEKAFARLLDQGLVTLDPGESLEQAIAARVEPGLRAARRVGNAYSASLYLQLAALVEAEPSSGARHDVTLFSYGSGFAASFGRARLLAGPVETGLAACLERARRLSVSDYEAARAATLALDRGESPVVPPSPGVQRFRFQGVRGERRVYARA